MAQAELIMAYETRQRTGKPEILPVQLKRADPLPYTVGARIVDIVPLNGAVLKIRRH